VVDLERARNQERTKDGLRAAKKRGGAYKSVGRSGFSRIPAAVRENYSLCMPFGADGFAIASDAYGFLLFDGVEASDATDVEYHIVPIGCCDILGDRAHAYEPPRP
jgi:hypothetical protein